jgi:hypothetical protein
MEKPVVPAAEGVEPEVMETPEVTETPETPETSEDGVEVPFERDEESGMFIWKLDPNDPNAMVYKGKTVAELLENVKKNVSDKDAYIVKLKTSKAVSAQQFKESASTASPVVELPSAETILTDHIKSSGLDPMLFGFTEEQWAQHEQEHGSFKTNRLYEKVEAVKKQAENAYGRANVTALNNIYLDEETSAVSQLVEEEGVELTEEEYTDILHAVHSDPKNFHPTGVRKQGVVLKAATKLVMQKVREATQSSAQKKTEEDIASRKARADGSTPEGPPKKFTVASGGKKAKDMDQAAEAALSLLKRQKH